MSQQLLAQQPPISLPSQQCSAGPFRARQPREPAASPGAGGLRSAHSMLSMHVMTYLEQHSALRSGLRGWSQVLNTLVVMMYQPFWLCSGALERTEGGLVQPGVEACRPQSASAVAVHV